MTSKAHLLLIAAMLAATVLAGMLMPRSAQAQSATFVVVLGSDDVEVGETILAVGLHPDPFGLKMTIEYTHHFVPEGDPCPATSGGSIEDWDDNHVFIYLTACTPGEATVRLIATETGHVLAAETFPVIDPNPPPPFSPADYDANGNCLIERNEVADGIEDYFEGLITRDDVGMLIEAYFNRDQVC